MKNDNGIFTRLEIIQLFLDEWRVQASLVITGTFLTCVIFNLMKEEIVIAGLGVVALAGAAVLSEVLARKDRMEMVETISEVKKLASTAQAAKDAQLVDKDKAHAEALKRVDKAHAEALKLAAKVVGSTRRRGEFLWLSALTYILDRDRAVKAYNALLAAYRKLKKEHTAAEADLLKAHIALKEAHRLLQIGATATPVQRGRVLQAVDASRAASDRRVAVYTKSDALRLEPGALGRRGVQARRRPVVDAIVDKDNPLGGDKPTREWGTGELEALRVASAATAAADAEVSEVAKRARAAEPKPELPAWRGGWGGHAPDAPDGRTEVVIFGVPNTGEFDTQVVLVDDLEAVMALVALPKLGPLAGDGVT
jgi:hypothetical protein